MTACKIRKRIEFRCKFKHRLTMEEAAERLYRPYTNGCEIYLCVNCGYLHFGHKPKWEIKKTKPRLVGTYMAHPVTGMLRWVAGGSA